MADGSTPVRDDRLSWDTAPLDYAAAARCLDHALNSRGDPDVWQALVAVWIARLSREERRAVLGAAMEAADEEDVAVLDAMLGGAGEPLPWLLSPLDEAATWAALASPDERRAYAAACWREMEPEDRRAFLDYASRSRA